MYLLLLSLLLVLLVLLLLDLLLPHVLCTAVARERVSKAVRLVFLSLAAEQRVVFSEG